MENDGLNKEIEYFENVINCIDIVVKKADVWLKQRIDFSRSERELYQQERKVTEGEKQNMVGARPKPYFGRVDFICDDTPEEVSTYYFGKYMIPGKSHLLPEQKIPYVLNWQAPVSSLYYQPAENGWKKIDGTKIHAKVTLIRTFDIEDSQFRGYDDEYTSSTSGQVQAPISNATITRQLSKPKEGSLKDIIATIQPEQYGIIAASPDKVMIVQGVAGSGKTEIGLHRIAYLLSPHNELNLKISPENVVFFGPSKMFFYYISNVLPGLQIHRIKQTTVHDWLLQLKPKKTQFNLKDKLLVKYLKADKNNNDTFTSARLKGSLKIARVLEKYVEYKRKNLISNVAGTIIGSSGIILLDGKRVHKILKRAVTDYKLEPLNEQRRHAQTGVEAEIHRRTLSRPNENLQKKIDKQFNDIWPFMEAQEVYRDFLLNQSLLSQLCQGIISASEIRLLTSSINIKTNTLLREDIGPVCYMDYLLNGKKSKQRLFEHVVIDEAQDVSPIEFMLIYLYSSNKSFTILGDVNQNLLSYHGIRDWKGIAPIFAEEKPLRLDIRKGYRSTSEITKFSNQLLKQINHLQRLPIPFGRHGEKPIFYRSKSRSDMIEAIVADIESLINEEIKSIAILCKTAAESIKIKKEILASRIPVSSTGSTIQIGDITVTISSIYEAKGLEFDAVLLSNVGAVNYSNIDSDNTLLYLGATRAAHILHIHWYGKITQALNALFESDKKRTTKKIKKNKKIHNQKSGASKRKEEPVFDLITYLNDNDLKFIDNRTQGGALWLIGGGELSNYIGELKIKGYPFTYTHKGGRASDYKPAWYTAAKE